MIRKSLRVCALVGAITGAAISWGQDAAAPKVEAPLDAPAAVGGGIYGEFNMAVPDEAIGLVARQAGVDLVPVGEGVWTNAEPITLKVENGYFWPTFLSMCAQAKIRFMPDVGPAGRNRLRLYDAKQGSDPYAGMPQSVSQGFVVMAQSATRTYSIFYGKAAVPTRSTLQVQLQILADPVTPVSSWNAPSVTEAVDENGASLVPKDDRSNLVVAGANTGLMQRATIDLAENASLGKKLATLKGSLSGTAVIKTEKVELDLPLPPEGKTFKIPDYDIVLTSPAAGGAAGSNVLNVRFISHQAEAAARPNARRFQVPMGLVNSISVVDAQGNVLNARGGGFSSDAGNIVSTISVVSGRGGEPTKLIWKLPMETRQVQVPFAFKDLAIP